MSESITPPDNPFGRLALLIEVPDSDRRKMIDDIADAYAVYLGNEIPGGCMIYGLYRGKWIANVSARWLMTQFVTAARQMAASEFNNRGLWQQACNRVIELVEMENHGQSIQSALKATCRNANVGRYYEPMDVVFSDNCSSDVAVGYVGILEARRTYR